MTAQDEAGPPIGWAIYEAMGHRQVAGYLSEQLVAGQPMLRVDVPGENADDPPRLTQLYPAGSTYCITPCTEEAARQAARYTSGPMSRLALPRPEPGSLDDGEDLDDPLPLDFTG